MRAAARSLRAHQALTPVCHLSRPSMAGPLDMRTTSGVLGPRAQSSFYCPISMVRALLATAILVKGMCVTCHACIPPSLETHLRGVGLCCRS